MSFDSFDEKSDQSEGCTPQQTCTAYNFWAAKLVFCAPFLRLFKKSIMSQLSPRRVKSAPTIILYELRILRSAHKATLLLPLFEARVKKWRGMLRWALQASVSSRGEVVVQVVVERQALARIDNLFATWRKALAELFGVRKLKRASWTSDRGAADKGGPENSTYLADVKVLHDAFEAACAKLWAETLDPAAVRCSYIEPALPAPLGSSGSRTPAALSSAGTGVAPSASATAPVSASVASKSMAIPKPLSAPKSSALLAAVHSAAGHSTVASSGISGTTAGLADRSNGTKPAVAHSSVSFAAASAERAERAAAPIASSKKLASEGPHRAVSSVVSGQTGPTRSVILDPVEGI